MDVSSFYYPFLIGIEQEADEQGYDLLLITGSADLVSGRRRIYEQNFNRLSRADGAILLGHGDKDEVYQLLEDGFPFVYVGRRESPQDKISYVAADYVSATEQIVEYLVEHGHRRLAYIRTSRHNEASMDRLKGYQEAIQKFHVASTSTASWSGEIQVFTAELMSDYLRSGVTAFVVEDDALGQRLLEVARQLSLQCPRDFSLAVLGNPLNPMQVLPDWTSFNIPRREMGREALCLLVELLSKSNEEKILPLRKILPCTFVSGTTTGPVP
jgi:DNA-binding LacI/PurR family transcriptional regulator